MPSWRGREDEKRAVRPKGRVRTAHMEKITGKQHPMVYEQQSYTNHLPVWEEDSGRSGRSVAGYLTYQDKLHNLDSDDSEDAEGRGIWREVGHFNTVDRRRLHGGYDEYLYSVDGDGSPVPALQGLTSGLRDVQAMRRRKHGRHMNQEDYSRYSLAAHALTSFLIFCLMLVAFVVLQYLDVYGTVYRLAAILGSHLLQLYDDIRTDNLPRVAECTTSVNLLKIAECEIQTAFNRLLRHSLDQTMQFVSLALNADNVPHVVALLLGAYTALKTVVRTVHQPLMAAFSLTGSFLTSVYSRFLRTCEKNGI